ncbi:MAG: BON domain-containing protein, partial [Novipirellula sp. JB048]
MRRTYFGLAIATIAALGPMQVFGGDREIAQQIIQRLKVNRDSGALKDFSLDMKVDQGVVLFRGNVTQSAQKDLVLMTAEGIPGINDIVDEVTINGQLVDQLEPAATTTAKVVKPVKEVAVVATEPGVQADAHDELKLAVVAEAEGKPAAQAGFSFSQALAAQAATIREATPGDAEVVHADAPRLAMLEQMPSEVRPTAAVELNATPLPSADEQVVSSVVDALGQAQKAGQLRGFGVDVSCDDGVVHLKGRAASQSQRETIVRIVESTPGVSRVHDTIDVTAALPRLPKPT